MELKEVKFTKEHEEKLKMISIPTIENLERMEKNEERAEDDGLVACPCCGKGIKNERFFIRSVFGGSAYLKSDATFFRDAWPMAVGSECRKKFPAGYIIDATKESTDFK